MLNAPLFHAFKARNSGAFNIQHSTFNIHHSTFIIPHSSFNIQHSTFNIQHSTFNIQHSSFNIQHSSFNIQHSTFNIYKFGMRCKFLLTSLIFTFLLNASTDKTNFFSKRLILVSILLGSLESILLLFNTLVISL
jgi:hypothetical protein